MFSLPFQFPGFIVTQVETVEAKVIISATAKLATEVCPRCQQPSQSIHRYYRRSPQDLPVSGKTVQLVLRVHRFRCQNLQCRQRTFAERWPKVLASHAQRTERLTATITHFAGESSSEPGARLLGHVGIRASAGPLLRLAKNTSHPGHQSGAPSPGRG